VVRKKTPSANESAPCELRRVDVCADSLRLRVGQRGAADGLDAGNGRVSFEQSLIISYGCGCERGLLQGRKSRRLGGVGVSAGTEIGPCCSLVLPSSYNNAMFTLNIDQLSYFGKRGSARIAFSRFDLIKTSTLDTSLHCTALIPPSLASARPAQGLVEQDRHTS
jgi:hypothetical protein